MRVATLLATAAVFTSTLTLGASVMAKPTPASKPTIILVHGAFADSSSWNGVIAQLHKDGYSTIAVANPLRGVKNDAAAVEAVVASVKGPVVLVGHSYGGTVISAAANRPANIKALVYVAAFEPDAGENSLALSGKFPGSTLGDALGEPVKNLEGSVDLYIRQDKFAQQFAADLPKAQAELMAATQRPIAQAALVEPSGEPAWKKIASWTIFGSADLNIPPAAMHFMAVRAKSKKTVEVTGASHVLMISHPAEVVAIIEEAAHS